MGLKGQWFLETLINKMEISVHLNALRFLAKWINIICQILHIFYSMYKKGI